MARDSFREEKPGYMREALLLVGRTLTQVLADSMAIIASDPNRRIT